MSFFLNHRTIYAPGTSLKVSQVELPSKAFFNKPTFFGEFLKKIFKKKNLSLVTIYENNDIEQINFENLKDSGYITGFSNMVVRNDAPKLFGTYIQYEIDDEKFISTGHSVQNQNSCRLSAFGEFLERISVHFNSLSKKTLSLNSANSKTLNFIIDILKSLPQPQKKTVYAKTYPTSKSDFAKVPFVKVRTVRPFEKLFLPVNLFYYGNELTKYPILNYASTSGAGGGTNFYMAFLGAIYESIERDHFLLYWLSGIKPARLDNNTLPEDFRNLILMTEKKYKTKIYLLDISYEFGVKVFAAVIVDEVNYLASFGAAANSDPFVAMTKAYTESLAMFQATENISDDKWTTEVLSSRFDNPKIDQKVRGNIYSCKSGIEYLNKKFLSGDLVDYKQFNVFQNKFKDKKSEYKWIVSQFQNKNNNSELNYKIYFHEFKNSLLDKYNYCVVKVFVPALYKLWLHENLATPISPRLEEFFEVKSGKILEEVCQMPHPFP